MSRAKLAIVAHASTKCGFTFVFMYYRWRIFVARWTHDSFDRPIELSCSPQHDHVISCDIDRHLEIDWHVSGEHFSNELGEHILTVPEETETGKCC